MRDKVLLCFRKVRKIELAVAVSGICLQVEEDSGNHGKIADFFSNR